MFTPHMAAPTMPRSLRTTKVICLSGHTSCPVANQEASKAKGVVEEKLWAQTDQLRELEAKLETESKEKGAILAKVGKLKKKISAGTAKQEQWR